MSLLSEAVPSLVSHPSQPAPSRLAVILADLGAADLAGRDPRTLRAAALLIEAEALAAAIERRLPSDVVVAIDLSLDQLTAYVSLRCDGRSDDDECLDLAEATRLRDVLANVPGRAGLARFLAGDDGKGA